MKKYNWKTHYADNVCSADGGNDHKKYTIENETGSGEILEWDIFPGLQLIHNSLCMERCSSAVPLSSEIIEISYCAEGSYECDLDDARCFLIGPGDLSVGAVGRTEAHGWFPDGRYKGFTIFVEKTVFGEEESRILGQLSIDLKRISGLTGIREQRFIIHDARLAMQLEQIISDNGRTEMVIPMLRLKILELLTYLSSTNAEKLGVMPVRISKEQARIATLVQKKITADLSKHVTVEKLKEELHVGATAIKTSFKKVYGTSVYAYLKDCRLQKADQLLKETDLSIAEISMLVGYGNPGKFSVAYKNKYGESPRNKRVRLDQ